MTMNAKTFIISACLLRYCWGHSETDSCWLQPADQSARKAGIRWPWLLPRQPCRQWVWCFALSYSQYSTCSLRRKLKKKFADGQLTPYPPKWIFLFRPRHRERHNEKVSDRSVLSSFHRHALLFKNNGIVLCFQGNHKLLLTSTVLIYSDIHWSQPGEKRMTGGTNWQPKAAPTTTWNPVSMVTHILYDCFSFC